MIKLTEIKKVDNVVTSAAFVEDSKTPIALRYSISDDAFSSDSLPPGYEWCTAHISQARRFLKQNKDALPPERTIMWY
jgi:hypothetical protein